MERIAKVRLLAFILILLTALPARAESKDNCSKFASTVEVADCLDKEFAEADRVLDETYQAFLETLKGMEKNFDMPKGRLVDSLKESQSSWIGYRGKNCNFYFNLAAGGSAGGPNRLACEVKMTKERLEELSKQYKYWKER